MNEQAECTTADDVQVGDVLDLTPYDDQPYWLKVQGIRHEFWAEHAIHNSGYTFTLEDLDEKLWEYTTYSLAPMYRRT